MRIEEALQYADNVITSQPTNESVPYLHKLVSRIQDLENERTTHKTNAENFEKRVAELEAELEALRGANADPDADKPRTRKKAE